MRIRLSCCLLVLIAAGSLFGCASKPLLADKPIVRKIAVIPATEPLEFTLHNPTVAAFLSPIVETGIMLSAQAKAKEFNQKMAARHLELATRLTTIVVDSLRKAGHRVEVLENIDRPADDPDDVDYGRLKTDADVIVQLRFHEVGVLSPRSSSDYLPRVNVDGKLFIRVLDDAPYDETLYYGVDAKEKNPGDILADPKYKYPNFESVMAGTEELQRIFEDATDKLARVLATQLELTLATKTRASP